MYGEAFYGRLIAQHKTLYEFVKYQPVMGWVTQPTFIFIYLPNARSIQVNNVCTMCVYKAHTSVVI